MKPNLFIFLLLLAFAGGGVAYSQQCNNSDWITNPSPISIGLRPVPMTGERFFINGNVGCSDVAMRISYNDYYEGHLALLNPAIITKYTMIGMDFDLVLAAGNKGRNLILTTRNNEGRIKFATTPTQYGPDIERMTIITEGRIGISNTEPKNLLSVKSTIGNDFWDDNIHFQDLRFNCYAGSYFEMESENSEKQPDDTSFTESSNSLHKNILAGHSGIIQHQSATGLGKMLIAITGNNESDNTIINFFESGHPRGIMLQSFASSTNIGLGSHPESASRVKIMGRTADETANALKIVNWNNATLKSSSLFLVRNDGLVIIGSTFFHPITGDISEEAPMKLSVDGTIVAKEILVDMTGAKWSDFVFSPDYKLIPLPELEKSIKQNGKLPDMPSAEEVSAKGLKLAEMDAKLLQKIEELTLYVIQLKKENDAIKNELQQFKQSLNK